MDVMSIRGAFSLQGNAAVAARLQERPRAQETARSPAASDVLTETAVLPGKLETAEAEGAEVFEKKKKGQDLAEAQEARGGCQEVGEAEEGQGGREEEQEGQELQVPVGGRRLALLRLREKPGQ